MRDTAAEDTAKPISVSAGTVDKVIDLAFNPTREKIREVTVVDRLQGRLFPQLDMINMLRHYCLEVAEYRQNKELYRLRYGRDKPVIPDALDEYLYRTAQWQKSIEGKNLEKATDIALAETEAKAITEDTRGLDGDFWSE